MVNSVSNEEIEMIKQTLNENIEENIDDYEYFHIGEFIMKPNQCGCFKRKDSWYTYENDEKNYCTFGGPFSLQGIIYACAMMLHISKKFKKYRFSEEEFNIYLNNHLQRCTKGT